MRHPGAGRLDSRGNLHARLLTPDLDRGFHRTETYSLA